MAAITRNQVMELMKAAESLGATPTGGGPSARELLGVGGIGWLSPVQIAWTEVVPEPGTSVVARDEFDPATGLLHIHGKGRKERIVTVNWKAVRAIKAYQKIRKPRDEDEDHLFLTKFGKAMGPRSIEDVVQKYLREAGISDASTHALRHTFATQHVPKGTSLNVVRAALGHESLKTTSLYVELAREQMDKELQQNAL
jgi:integrase